VTSTLTKSRRIDLENNKSILNFESLGRNFPFLSRNGFQLRLFAFVGVTLAGGCASLPDSQYQKIPFPKKHAHLSETPPFPAEILGVVRAKISFPTTDPEHELEELCLSAFNQGAHDLIKKAKKTYKTATDVIGIQSIVFFLDGTKKAYPQAECSDDGNEGQVLMQGQAIAPLPPSNLRKKIK
jgi:hypothetical protein